MRVNEAENVVNNNFGALSTILENDLQIRQYINPAVYIEASYDMIDYKSPMCLNIPGSGDHPKIVKVKRCVCFTNPKHCPCHPYEEDDEPIEASHAFTTSSCSNLSPFKPNAKASDSCSPSSDYDSGITLKASYSYTNSLPDELRLSLPSLSMSSIQTVRYADEQHKAEVYKQWCARKDEEKKLLIEKEALKEKIIQKRKEEQLQHERENFKRWLTNKKKEEEENKKRDFERQDEALKFKQEMKERRMLENDLNYKLWLKRKEEITLERKIKEHFNIIKTEEEKQRRLEFSQRAYDIWVEQSKFKPKPVPLSRGLDTLRSSVSVTYINPVPWVPNVENPKPTSK